MKIRDKAAVLFCRSAGNVKLMIILFLTVCSTSFPAQTSTAQETTETDASDGSKPAREQNAQKDFQLFTEIMAATETFRPTEPVVHLIPCEKDISLRTFDSSKSGYEDLVSVVILSKTAALARNFANVTAKTELEHLVNERPIKVAALMETLTEVASGNTMASQREREQAQDIMMEIASAAPGPFDDIEGEEKTLYERSNYPLAWERLPPARLRRVMGMAALVPVRVAMAKLRTLSEGKKAQSVHKEQYRRLCLLVAKYQFDRMPARVAIREREDADFVRQVKDAAEKLLSTGFDDLDVAVRKMRSIAEARMAKAVEDYMSALVASGIPELKAEADEIKALREKYSASQDPSIEEATEIARILAKVSPVIDFELKSAREDTKTKLEILKIQTHNASDVMKVLASHPSVYAALEGL